LLALVLEVIDFLRLRILVAFSALCNPIMTARMVIVVMAAAVAVLAWVEDVSFEKTATAGSVIDDRAPAMIDFDVCRILEWCWGVVCFSSWDVSIAVFLKNPVARQCCNTTPHKYK